MVKIENAGDVLDTMVGFVAADPGCVEVCPGDGLIENSGGGVIAFEELHPLLIRSEQAWSSPNGNGYSLMLPHTDGGSYV